MDPLKIDIRQVSPTNSVVAPLLAIHLTLMRASSPACSIHALEAKDLAEANAQFFAAFENEKAVAIGALKILTPDHGEIKSMHVRADRRGRGLADAMLAQLIQCAQGLGIKRISLETGSQDAFKSARSFYHRRDFAECPPFDDYQFDANSVFMTRTI